MFYRGHGHGNLLYSWHFLENFRAWYKYFQGPCLQTRIMLRSNYILDPLLKRYINPSPTSLELFGAGATIAYILKKRVRLCPCYSPLDLSAMIRVTKKGPKKVVGMKIRAHIYSSKLPEPIETAMSFKITSTSSTQKFPDMMMTYQSQFNQSQSPVVSSRRDPALLSMAEFQKNGAFPKDPMGLVMKKFQMY